MRLVRASLFAASLLLLSAPAFAQRGCFHSPEAPTDVLMLVGSAGMFLGSGPLVRLLRRRRTR